MLIAHERPRAHLVLDGFFGPEALETIFAEIQSLGSRLKPGLVRDVAHDGQSVFFAHPRRQNKAVWLHDPSKTLRLFREHLGDEALTAAFDGATEPLFQIIPHCWSPNVQVSTYMTGDHYALHEDEGAGVNLTAIVFLALEPQKVHGGDLVLSYRGDEAKVRFRHNRLVIFPSKTPHRVTRVRVDSEDPRYARISLQSWLAFGRPPVAPKTRRPEADRPTFLLAEPSILSAAQALTGASGADQSPEDLYWGALYLSRILSANLRCLTPEEGDLSLGPVRIRRAGDLQVHRRGKLGSEPLRVGFQLLAPPTPVGEALYLFVETGRGKAATTWRRRLPAGASEREAATTLRKLIAGAAKAAGVG